MENTSNWKEHSPSSTYCEQAITRRRSSKMSIRGLTNTKRPTRYSSPTGRHENSSSSGKMSSLRENRGPVPSLNLRRPQRIQNQVRDVAHRGFKSIARVSRKLLPVRIVRERRPLGIQLIQAVHAQHISQGRKTRADQRVTVKHRVQPRSLEVIELALVKHLHLAHMVPVTRALIRTHLKNPLTFGRRCLWRRQLGPALERDVQRALHALERIRSGRRAPPGLRSLLKIGVFRQMQIHRRQFLHRSARYQQIICGSLRPDTYRERADAPEALLRQRRN